MNQSTHNSRLFPTLMVLAITALPGLLTAQSIGIGTPTPDASAILDIQSNAKGILVPRMTTAERTAISSPASGLLVFDTTTGSFWYFHTAWTNLGSATKNLVDTDGDTKVQVEENPDEDIIRFDLAGMERMVLQMNANQIPRLELPNTGNNTFVGVNAGLHHGNGNDNTALGVHALRHNVTGSGNTAIGASALYANTGGSGNLAIGTTALYANTTGYGNLAIGNATLPDNTSGYYNIAIGPASLSANTTGHNNVGLGRNTLWASATGNYNTAIGHLALQANTAGSDNTAIGFGALFTNKANNRSTAVGVEAMGFADDRTTGRATYNTAIGYQALLGQAPASSNTGQYNTAVGDQAMRSNTSGSNNVSIGAEAMYNNSSGASNAALGRQSLFANTTGLHNSALGYQALDDNSTGTNNTGVGSGALNQNTTGSGNTALGRSAYFTLGGLNNTTCIGYLSGAQANVSNRVEIGNASVSWIGGEVNWSTYSDARIKRDIRENVPGLDFITRLRPVTYHLDIHAQNALTLRGKADTEDWPEKYDIEQKQMTGFIAQEVEAAALAAGYDFSGVEQAADDVGLYSVRYAEFVVPLVKAVQEQQSIIAEQQSRIAAHQEVIARLETSLAATASLQTELTALRQLVTDMAKQLATPETR